MSVADGSQAQTATCKIHVNFWNEAEADLNVSGGTFTSGPEHRAWVNGFNKQKKSTRLPVLSFRNVCKIARYYSMSTSP